MIYIRLSRFCTQTTLARWLPFRLRSACVLLPLSFLHCVFAVTFDLARNWMYPARDQAVAPSSRDTYGGGGNSKPDRCRAHHRVCFSRAAARSLSQTESNIPVEMGSACYRCRSLISIFPSLSLSFSLSLASFPLLLQCHIGHVGGILRCLLRRALNCLMPFLVIHFCQPIPSGSVCRLFI